MFEDLKECYLIGELLLTCGEMCESPRIFPGQPVSKALSLQGKGPQYLLRERFNTITDTIIDNVTKYNELL